METRRNDRTTEAQRKQLGQQDEAARHEYQIDRLNRLLAAILPQNEFYRSKLKADQLTLTSIDQIADLPLTTKQELVSREDGSGYAANLTYTIDQYSRFHRTSGTSGRPMVVLDTNEDWDWWMEAWQFVLDSASLQTSDRVLMAFSFGPFIGFWSAFDAATERGAMVIPTGAMSSVERLKLILSSHATVVCCTPSYALHLAECAKTEGGDLTSSKVSRLIVAGEPGGSIPSVRKRIEDAWGAKVIDHCGASEVGPWGFADEQRTGIHINEAEFIPEFLPLGSTASDAKIHASEIVEGEDYELILTCLGRFGSPVIRYRTGDLVRPVWLEGEANCRYVLLKSGVLGRADDMMIIRGVNVFPTSVEQILREIPEITEFRMTAYRKGEMDQLKVEVEDELNQPARIEQALQVGLGFRVEVSVVEANSLPRFAAKGKRFVDER